VFLLCLNFKSEITDIAIQVFIVSGLILILTLVFTSKKQAHVSKSFYLIAFLPFILFLVFSFILFLMQQLLHPQSELAQYIELNQNYISETTSMFFPLSQVFALTEL